MGLKVASVVVGIVLVIPAAGIGSAIGYEIWYKVSSYFRR